MNKTPDPDAALFTPEQAMNWPRIVTLYVIAMFLAFAAAICIAVTWGDVRLIPY